MFRVVATTRVIKLMNTTMKIWKRVVEAKVREKVMICEEQYGFMPRKITIDAMIENTN